MHEVEPTLALVVLLVVGVVGLFLRNLHTALIPAVLLFNEDNARMSYVIKY